MPLTAAVHSVCVLQKREEKTRRADQEAHERTMRLQKEEQKIVAQARAEVEVIGTEGPHPTRRSEHSLNATL